MYWPLRLQAFIFILVFLLLRASLGYFIHDETSSYQAIATLILKIVYVFTGGMLVLSTLSVSIPYLFNLIQSYRKKVNPNLTAGTSNLTIFSVKGMLLPFLGSVSVRLIPAGRSFTILTQFQSIASIPIFMRGVLHWKEELVDVYRVRSIVIYHCDFLHLFRLPLNLVANFNLSHWPEATGIKERSAPASAAIKDEFRIEELKRIEGEYLSYKAYEFGDDIRRIVWNVYARNRELVIRQPESFNPYASHIHFVPLFYADIPVIAPPQVIDFYLSEFKQQIWKVFLELESSGCEVRFQSALTSNANYYTDKQVIRNQITNYDWLSISESGFIIPNNFSGVVVLSALSPDSPINEILAQPNITLIYIPLSYFELRKRPFIEKLFMKDELSIRPIHDFWQLNPAYRELQSKDKYRLNRFKNYPNVQVLGNATAHE